MGNLIRLVVLLGLSLVLVAQPVSEPAQVWLAKVDMIGAMAPLFRLTFTEPFETMIVIDRNWMMWTLSTHDSDRINIPATSIYDFIKRAGLGFEDMILVAHNHWIPAGPSPSDIKTLGQFRAWGFVGRFVIYYPVSGDIKEVRLGRQN